VRKEDYMELNPTKGHVRRRNENRFKKEHGKKNL